MAPIDPREVLIETHQAKTAFEGQVVAEFRRMGPNAWDAYERIALADGPIQTVLPGVHVQLEERGTFVRMRVEGRVVVLRFLPDPSVLAEAGESKRALREAFVQRWLQPLTAGPQLGAAAVIVSKLNGSPG